MAGILLGLAATAQDFDNLLPLAKAGHNEAQNNLGSLYYAGDGVSQHFGETIKWYRLAAEQGDDWAQNALVTCITMGRVSYRIIAKRLGGID